MTCGPSTPTSPSSSTSAQGPATRRTRRPREWIDRYRGRFDGGWDAWRERTFARQLELGVIPPGTAPLAPPAVGAGVGRARRRPSGRWPAGSWSASPASCRTPTRRSAGCVAFLEDIGDLDNTVIIFVSDNGASAEGGPEGSINDIRLTNLDPAGIDEMHERIDEIGGPAHPQQLPVGLDHGRQHPVQALEARGPRGGGGRSLHRPWPAAPAASRRGVRHQFAHAIDVLPTVLELARGRGARQRSKTSPSPTSTASSFAYLLGPDGAGRPPSAT